VLDATGPAPSEITARGIRRKRSHRLALGLGGVALAGAGALIAVVVVAVLPTSGQTVAAGDAPTHQSLKSFAAHHGGIDSRFGRQVSGPAKSPTGFFGAFTVKSGVRIAAWSGSRWRLDGTVSTLGQGRSVMRLTAGPTLKDMPTPTFYVRTVGGDVSYFGSVLQNHRGTWAPVHFTGCKHHGLCPPGTSEPYARPHIHPDHTRMVSVHNTCKPSCANGTEYRVRWWWALKVDPRSAHVRPIEVFAPARVRKVS